MDQRQVFYFAYKNTKRNTAGSKAPEDIVRICAQQGFREITMPQMPQGKGKLYIKCWLLTVAVIAWRKANRRIPKEAILIFQHPSYGMRLSLRYLSKLQNRKKCKTIAIIHDLESLRGGIAGALETNQRTNSIGDNAFLKQFNAIICHNEHMRQYLITQGFHPEKLVNLGIFDYLGKTRKSNDEKHTEPSIAIAGNLAPGKCSYIYKIYDEGRNPNLILHLFGNKYDASMTKENMIYHGSFAPDELPEHLAGDFGLVWDGPEAVTCTGNTGEYLKYNNPHKTSLYLSAGMPVIVWDQAAIADYVKQNKVGITIGNLLDLEKTLTEISDQEYSEIRKNVNAVSQKLKNGYYTIRAISEAIMIVQ